MCEGLYWCGATLWIKRQQALEVHQKEGNTGKGKGKKGKEMKRNGICNMCQPPTHQQHNTQTRHTHL